MPALFELSANRICGWFAGHRDVDSDITAGEFSHQVEDAFGHLGVGLIDFNCAPGLPAGAYLISEVTLGALLALLPLIGRIFRCHLYMVP